MRDRLENMNEDEAEILIEEPLRLSRLAEMAGVASEQEREAFIGELSGYYIGFDQIG